MQLSAAEEAHLQQWVQRQLSSLRLNSSPDAVAQYVMSLVRRGPGREALAALCRAELQTFLKERTPAFVAALVGAIADGSYKPAGRAGKETRRDRGDSDNEGAGDNEDNNHSHRSNDKDNDDANNDNEGSTGGGDRDRVGGDGDENDNTRDDHDHDDGDGDDARDRHSNSDSGDESDRRRRWSSSVSDDEDNDRRSRRDRRTDSDDFEAKRSEAPTSSATNPGMMTTVAASNNNYGAGRGNFNDGRGTMRRNDGYSNSAVDDRRQRYHQDAGPPPSHGFHGQPGPSGYRGGPRGYPAMGQHPPQLGVPMQMPMPMPMPGAYSIVHMPPPQMTVMGTPGAPPMVLDAYAMYQQYSNSMMGGGNSPSVPPPYGKPANAMPAATAPALMTAAPAADAASDVATRSTLSALAPPFVPGTDASNPQRPPPPPSLAGPPAPHQLYYGPNGPIYVDPSVMMTPSAPLYPYPGGMSTAAGPYASYAAPPPHQQPHITAPPHLSVPAPAHGYYSAGAPMVSAPGGYAQHMQAQPPPPPAMQMQMSYQQSPPARPKQFRRYENSGGQVVGAGNTSGSGGSRAMVGAGSSSTLQLPEHERLTLRATKIPSRLTESAVRAHFELFGTVVEFQMTPMTLNPAASGEDGDTAEGAAKTATVDERKNECLVQYLSAANAKKCLGSSAPILNCRFVKLAYSNFNVTAPTDVMLPDNQSMEDALREDARLLTIKDEALIARMAGNAAAVAAEKTAMLKARAAAVLAGGKRSIGVHAHGSNKYRRVEGAADARVETSVGGNSGDAAGDGDAAAGDGDGATAGGDDGNDAEGRAVAVMSLSAVVAPVVTAADLKMKKDFEKLKDLRQQAESILKQKESLLQTQLDKCRAMATKLEAAEPSSGNAALLSNLEGKIVQLQSQLRGVREQIEKHNQHSGSSAATEGSTAGGSAAAAAAGGGYAGGVAGRRGGGGRDYYRGGGRDSYRGRGASTAWRGGRAGGRGRGAKASWTRSAEAEDAPDHTQQEQPQPQDAADDGHGDAATGEDDAMAE